MADSFDRLRTALSDRHALERAIGAGGMARVYPHQAHKPGRRGAVTVRLPPLDRARGAGRPADRGHFGPPIPGVVIHQGDDMGRPSRITVTVTTDDAGADTVQIGGGGVVMSEGEFLL